MVAFSFQTDADMYVIKFPSQFDAKAADAFSKECASWLALDVSTYVFDLSPLKSIDSAAYHVIVPFVNQLKDKQKKLFTVGATLQVRNMINQDGLSGCFSFRASIDEVKKPAPTGTAKKIDVTVLNPFIKAAIHTLEVQCSLPSKAGKPYIKKDDSIPVEIVGVLTLISDKFMGSVSLCFSSVVFLKVYEKMLGEVHTEITQEIEDAVSEMLNIMYGAAKTELNANQEFNFKPALPTVLVGEKMRIRHKTDEAVIILPFESEVGPFHIEITGKTI